MDQSKNTWNLLKEEDVALILGIKLKTLQSWRYQGVGPKYLAPKPRIIRYRDIDVYKWIEERSKEKERKINKGVLI
jgi:predicted DNA-binding transcriptional regulator AlpA